VVHAAAADASASEDLLRGDLLEVSFEEQIAHRADQPLASSAGRATTPGGRRCCCRFGWGIDTGQSLRYFTNRQSVGKDIRPTGLSTGDTNQGGHHGAVRNPQAQRLAIGCRARGIRARSTKVADEQMPDDVRWIRSYVLQEDGGSVGTVCIYQASSPEAIRDHASRADLPVDEIIPVADTVLVRPDPATAAA
jgi:hypothetical protein